MKEAVPFFRKDAFLTDEPYKYLLNTDFPSESEKALAEAQVRQNAEDVGFKGFDRVWKSFCQSSAKTLMKPLEQGMTDFGVGTPTLYCGQYECSEDGIGIYAKDGMKIIFPHPIYPSKVFRNVDTDEVSIEVTYIVGGIKRKRVVPKDVLSSTQKIITLSNYGIMVNSRNAAAAVAYMADMEVFNENTIPYEECVNHLGWIGNESERFSPYCGVTFDDSDRDGKRIFDSMNAPRGTLEAWLAVADEVRKAKRLPAKIALAAAFAAPLVKPLGCLCFVVHLHGDSGCGKTVALHMAASVWADPKNSGYIKSFDSTKVGRELHAAFCNSVPVIIDETQLASRKDGMDGTVYALCEGISRSKGTKDGGAVQQKRWQTVIITSGENSLSTMASGTGAVARVVDAEFGGEDLFDDNVAVANTVQKNFAHAGRAFIEWLTDEKNMDKVKDWYDEFLAAFGKEVQDKQAMAAACLLTADRAYTECLGLDEKNSLRVSELMKCLVSKEQADINERTHEWLLSTIAANPIRFEKDPDLNKGEVWGVKDEETEDVYFISAKLEPMMRKEGFDYDPYLKWAKRKGKIQGRGDGKHMTVQRTICGMRNIACVKILGKPSEETMPWEV